MPTLTAETPTGPVPPPLHQDASPSKATGTGTTVDPDLPTRLQRALAKCSSPVDSLQVALKAITHEWNAVYYRMACESHSGKYQDEAGAVEAWSRLCQGLQLKARLGQAPVARSYRSSASELDFALLTVPWRDGDGRVVGAASVVLQVDSPHVIGPRLSELAALLALTHELIYGQRRSTHGPEHSRSDLTRVAKAAQYESVQEFAFSLVNTLKNRMDCEQVSLGIVQSHSVQILAISGLDTLYPRAPGCTVIMRAMQECLDARVVLCFQSETIRGKGGAHTGHRLHQQWHEEAAHACVASVPLLLGDRCVALLGLRRRTSEPFSSADLQRVSEMASPLAAGLLLLDRGQRSLRRHGWEVFWSESSKWLGRGGRGRRVVAMAAAAFGLWFATAQRESHVTLACHVRPVDQRTLSAPFEGVLQARYVEPGDRVTAGQLLARMDTRELLALREEAAAAAEVAGVERAHATAKRDLAAAAQAHARWKVAEARIALLDNRVQQAELRSPTDGIILEGELTHRVGQVVPLGEPLLEFAPGQHWCVELEVPEHFAPLVALGQLGSFAPIVRPGSELACQIESVQATARLKHNHNVYLARADIQDAPPSWLRSGMEGVAHVHVGRHPVWWMTFRRLFGAIQLQLWNW